MSDTDPEARLHGYEWGMDCGGCGEPIDLSGMHHGNHATEGTRIRVLESGDTITCSKCGNKHEIVIQETDRDNT